MHRFNLLTPVNRMRRQFQPLLLISGLLFCTALGASMYGSSQFTKSDSLVSFPSNTIKIEGYLGGKIDRCIEKRIKTQDPAYLTEPFTHRTETHLWQTEFWGKWILSAIAAYQYKQDPELLNKIKDAVSLLLKTQTPDGYIGNYAPEAQLQHWDIWGRKYTLLGLLHYYEISKDKTALMAAQKLADHLLTQLGPGKANIVKTGNYRGMPSSSILEPMVLLYRITGKKEYLDFSKYIVTQWETPEGPQLISKALKGIPVADRFPHPKSWWSWENGQKAYEMMSCYEGLLDLYRVTENVEYLKAVELAVQTIIESEINIAGSGTTFECFYHGASLQTIPTYHTMETCVTFTWMKLCINLLRLTGNPTYADQIEKTTYNALLASMKYDGSQIAKYSPLEGTRQQGEEQCGMHINCCNANGPRAFTMLPNYALLFSGKEIFVNLYNQLSATFPISKTNNVSVKINTVYPVTDRIEIIVTPQKQEAFSMNLRIPAWSGNTEVYINDVKQQNVKPGSYYRIARKWAAGDKVSLKLDLQAKLITRQGFQAIVRGPVVLARDSRFNDGFVDEAAIIQQNDSIVNLQPASDKPENVWMAFTAPLVVGTDLEGEYKTPKLVHFCDFGSAGNDWNRTSRYRVWIKQTLNVMKIDYKPY